MPTDPTTQLFFDFHGDGDRLLARSGLGRRPRRVRRLKAQPVSIAFADVETGDTHTASFVPQDGDYVGTFSLDPVS